VSIEKLGAWYLLMLLSFVLVSLVHRPAAAAARPSAAPTLARSVAPGATPTQPDTSAKRAN
jgi:hypothetical protein